MSYILDALRRADAERERGAVPGLHAQPVPTAAPPTDAPRLPRGALLLALGVIGGLVVVAAAWQLGGDDAPTAAVAPAPAPPPAPAPSPPATTAPATPPLTTTPAPRTADVRSAPPRPPARRPPPATPPPAEVSAPPQDRVVALNELPDDVRRDLPALKLGGSIYSEDPKSRFLIVNGQMFRENDTLAPGLTLKRIQPRSAVFAYKGWSVEVK